MRVLMLTNNPNLGASARVLQSWLPMARDHNVHPVVVMQARGPLTDWLADEQFPHLVDPMPGPDIRRPLPALWHAWRIWRWARRFRPQLIHCHEHNLHPFALVLRRITGLPLVCYVHYRLDRGFAHWAFGRASRLPDALLWTSDQQRIDSHSATEGIIPPYRQYRVPLGLDVNCFRADASLRREVRARWQIDDDQVVIGSANALRPRKRVHEFVQLVTDLAKRYPRVVGLVAGSAMPGDEEYAAQITEQVNRAQLGDRLRMLGNLDQIEPFMHAIDVFVSTSEYETFGMSVCEAMACTRPVAAYSGGSVHEVVGSAGCIVPTGDLAALTDAVEHLVVDGDYRAELGAAARQRVVEQFDTQASFNQLHMIYEDLLRTAA
jgi:glycosyltransferase involved in cell wall biosynthesis